MAEPARQLDDEEQNIYDAPGAAPSSPKPDLKAIEGGGHSTPPKHGHLRDVSAPSRGDLANAEESPDEPRHENLVGKGYSGNKGLRHEWEQGGYRGTTKSLSKFFIRNRKNALIGGAVSAILISLILIFLSLIPLKIASFIANIQNTFAATTEDAVGKESEHMLDKYIVNKVLPGLGKNKCFSTISNECSVASSSGKGPVSKVFNVWRENRIENKLAKNYGLIFGKKGSVYYIHTNGRDFSLGDHPTSIFNMEGVTTTRSRAEVRQAIREALKNETLWKRTLFRFRYGKFLEKKYGIRRCIITCKLGDKYADSFADKKLAAKAYIVRRVIAPVNESYALIMQCVLDGGCDITLDRAEPGEDTKLSPFQKKLQAQLDAFAARYGADALKDLVKTASDIGKDGVKKYLARELAKKAGQVIGKDVTGDLAAKAVSPIGWAFMIARFVSIGQNIGPMIRYMSYAANAAAAVQLYQSYTTVASEMKSGNIDAAELGSFTEALTTNLDGSGDNQSDITQTPLYQSLYGDQPSSVATLIDSFSNKAYAAAASPTGSSKKYICNDGNPVPSGQLVCPEEKLDRGNETANEISSEVQSIVSAVPYLDKLLGAINHIGNAVGGVIGTVFDYACTWIFSIHTVFFGVYGCKTAMDYIGSKASDFMDFLAKKLIVSPFSDSQSGGRTGDMAIAGGDVLFNGACKEQLGCAKLSDAQVSEIRNQQIAEREAEFNSLPVLARLFSKDTPYSVVSRLAMVAPTNFHDASSSVLNLFTSTFNSFGSNLFSVFGRQHAFAATGPQPDPFGVVQYGYDDSQIPDDPEAYWDNNCVDGPMGKYNPDTGQLDISDWLNDESNSTQDTNTGESMNIKPNPCLLIRASSEALGGAFDTSLLPSDSLNSGAGAQTASNAPSGTVSSSAQDLAKQILDLSSKGKITIADYSENPTSDRNDRSLASLQLEDIANGKPASGTTRCSFAVPSQITPDPVILQFLVDLAQKQHYTLNVLFGQCHSGPDSNHYKGKAVDFGCPFDPTQANTIGQKYNIFDGTGETCSSGAGHYHYSIGGN